MKRFGLPGMVVGLFMLCWLSPGGDGIAFAASDSPPDLVDAIFWDEDPATPGLQQSFLGVESVEKAFNNGRRIEEVQLGLTPGVLGMLALPAQEVWDRMTDDAKALYIINAERQARGLATLGISGLPMTGIESHIDQNAAWYGDYLYDNNLTEFTDPDYLGANSPFSRIDKNPDLGESATYGACHEYLHYAENIAYFAEISANGPPPLPLPLERAIYNWIYTPRYLQGSTSWDQRRAVLVQSRTLDMPAYEYGYKNNHGESGSEGYLGIYVRIGTRYNAGDPLQNGLYYTGGVVVMDIFDPIGDLAERQTGDRPCHYNPGVGRLAAASFTGLAERHVTELPNDRWVQLTPGGEPGKGEQSVQAIFGDDLPLAGYGTDWIVFAFDPVSNMYTTLSLNDALVPRQAYWVLQRTGSDVMVDMPPSTSEAYVQYCDDAECMEPLPCNSAKGCVVIPLQTSPARDLWQMIGHPSRASIPVDQVQVVTIGGGPCENGCNLNTAALYYVVGDQFWHYDGSGYTAMTTVGPWEGFWVLAKQTSSYTPVLLLPLP